MNASSPLAMSLALAGGVLAFDALAGGGETTSQSSRFRLSLSDDVIRSFVEAPVVDHRDLNDIVSGTGVWGKTCLYARPSVRFVPNANRAELEITAEADIFAETWEPTPYARVDRTTTTRARGTKRIQFDAFEANVEYAATDGVSTSVIDAITPAGGYEPNSAYSYAMQQALARRPAFESSRNEQARWWLASTLDNLALSDLLEVNIVGALLETLGIQNTPHNVAFSTSDRRLYVDYRAGDDAGKNPVALPPSHDSEAAIDLQVHETALMGIVGKVAGTTFRARDFAQLFGGQVVTPREPASDGEASGEAEQADDTEFALAEEEPLRITFADDVLSVELRLARLSQNGRDYPARDISFRYQVQDADGLVALKRIGAIGVLPPHHREGDPLSLTDRLLAGGIRDSLGKMLKEEITLEGLQTLVIQQGWLTVRVREPDALTNIASSLLADVFGRPISDWPCRTRIPRH